MKKLSCCFLAAFLVLTLFLEPFSVKAEEPIPEAPAIQLQYTELEESERWILDEVLSDYVSEHVIETEEAAVPCTIGEQVDRDTASYLFYQDETQEGILYTAAGYALNRDGGYVYFTLTSDAPLDPSTVDLEIARNFGSIGDTDSLT
ncbi:hypothetical protein H8S44_10285 [Anaerosacchariphilus sp. NSJ-68]|uniref:DUF4830 domain-containing protein n=2 Tax=Lachnospiraceae TaxID=186803 RepID=A0A923RMD4_9FIRM|nr:MULTISPECIES: hypothetical protein [Lachnospiraceae]MBC5660159.1 hypothetical protein [Anaerosacchariphilus hominis]MBC5699274.1 hypothetical protein [Roseburia difficilis]